MPSALQLLLMANKTKIVRHTHRPMYENIYTRGDEKQWKCWAINKNETKKKKKREVGWHVFLPFYEISKGSSADGKATTCTNITTAPASLTRVKKKRKKKNLYRFIFVGWMLELSQDTINVAFLYRGNSLSFKSCLRDSNKIDVISANQKTKNRMIRFKFFFPLICNTGRMYIEGKNVIR